MNPKKNGAHLAPKVEKAPLVLQLGLLFTINGSFFQIIALQKESRTMLVKILTKEEVQALADAANKKKGGK